MQKQTHSVSMASGVAISRSFANAHRLHLAEAANPRADHDISNMVTIILEQTVAMAEHFRRSMLLDVSTMVSAVMIAQPLVHAWFPDWHLAYTTGILVGAKLTLDGFHCDYLITHGGSPYSLSELRRAERSAVDSFKWKGSRALFPQFRGALLTVAFEFPKFRSYAPSAVPPELGAAQFDLEQSGFHSPRILLMANTQARADAWSELFRTIVPGARCICTSTLEGATSSVIESCETNNSLALVVCDAFHRDYYEDGKVAESTRRGDSMGLSLADRVAESYSVLTSVHRCRPLILLHGADGLGTACELLQYDGSLGMADAVLKEPIALETARTILEFVCV